ncbi:MAG: DNA polymerase III subunit gamma/tau C-terminal domain-containing protein, partial [Gammaproteobacteria bacterium]
ERIAALAEAACVFRAALGVVAAALKRVGVRLMVGGARAADDEPRIDGFAGRMGAEDCQLWYQIALLARRDLPLAPDPRGGFEMAMLRMLAFRLEPPGAAQAVPAAGPARTAPPAPGRRERGPEQVRTAPAAPAPQAPSAQAVPVRAAPAPVVPAGPDRTAARAGVPAPGDAGAWARLIDTLGLTGLARELAANCVFAGMADGEFRLQLSARAAQLRGGKTERRLEEVLREHFGPDLRIRISETADDGGAETPFARQSRLTREQEEAAAQAIAADPNVRAIVARFDARIESTSAKSGPSAVPLTEDKR